MPPLHIALGVVVACVLLYLASGRPRPEDKPERQEW